jgi:hypothetical protein
MPSELTGYSPVEQMFNYPKPDLFEKFLKKWPEQRPPKESLQEKVLKAYIRARAKAAGRNKRGSCSKWKP